MGDLIERLRADEWGPYATERREAADELERLRNGVIEYANACTDGTRIEQAQAYVRLWKLVEDDYERSRP